jgi:hypothetical protein
MPLVRHGTAIRVHMHIHAINTPLHAGIILWELYTREQPYMGLRYIILCVSSSVSSVV